MMNVYSLSPPHAPIPDIPGLAPVPSATLLGRDTEVHEILRLLETDTRRVITLLGPGGVGKTRLAEEVTRASATSFVDGARFIRLEGIRDHSRLARAVIDQLKMQPRGDLPLEQIVEQFLADRHMLLVLDNVEQVVGAASAWISRLATAAPRLRIIVTSRIPLHIQHEQQYLVSPLPMPVTDPIRNPAVLLFAERARAVRHDFTLDDATAAIVATICEQLDGLPLAIELAAARMKVLSPDALMARLTDRLALLIGGQRDMPLRLRSMRDAIAWSYELLSADEQQLFRRLSVFSGAVALETVEFIAAWPDPPGAASPALDTLQSLVEQSLVQITRNGPEPMFRMLETIREYGLSLLDPNGDDAHRAHADYYLDLALQADPALAGPDQASWLRRLDADYHNLRAAASWLETHGRLDDAIELMARIRFFLVFRGHLDDALPLLTTWLECLDPLATSRSRGLLLMMLGRMHQDTGRSDLAESMLAESVGILTDAGDSIHAATAQGILAVTYLMAGKLDDARLAAETTLNMAQGLGMHRITCAVLGVLARIAASTGNRDRARQLTDASIRVATDGGDRWSMAFSRYYAGEDAIEEGDLDDARQHIEAFRQVMEEIGSLYDLAVAWSILAWIDRARGNIDDATDEIANALTIASAGGYRDMVSDLSRRAAIIALEKDDFDAATESLSVAAAGLRAKQDPTAIDRTNLAETLEAYATLAAKVGDAGAAGRFLGAAGAIWTSATERCTDPSALAEAHASQRLAAASLGKAAFRRERQAGAAWTIDDAIAAMTAWTPTLAPRERPTTSTDHPLGTLSPRELEILRHIASGMTNQGVADLLFLSHRTVTTHVTSILGKLGVDSRTAAVAWAIRTGIA